MLSAPPAELNERHCDSVRLVRVSSTTQISDHDTLVSVVMVKSAGDTCYLPLDKNVLTQNITSQSVKHSTENSVV